MNRTEIEQDVFEKLTLRDFKMRTSTALKTSKKCNIIMTNNRNNNKNIMSVVLLSLFLIFELIQQTAAVNYMLLLSILKILNGK